MILKGTDKMIETIETKLTFEDMLDDFLDFKEPDYKTNYWDWYEEQLPEIKQLAERYQYKIYETPDGQIIITTPCECWKFKPKMNGVIKLMHGNHLSENFHVQFKQQISYSGLFMYMADHEMLCDISAQNAPDQ